MKKTHTFLNSYENEINDNSQKIEKGKRKTNLPSNNVFLLLVDEESVELVDLDLQEVEEIDNLLGHLVVVVVLVQSGAFIIVGVGAGLGRVYELKLLLEVLVRQELVLPFRQGLLD